MTGAAAVAPAVDPWSFRRALGRFATGVALVTAPGGEALVVSAFASVSLEPPLVAFCTGRTSSTWRRMRRSALLGVSVLPREVADVHQRARPGRDRLAGLAWRPDPAGVPRLDDAVAFLRCARRQEIPAGDHWLVLCEVLRAEWDETRSPLVAFGGAVGGFAP
jgi:flavin reductase (DIM6/NTAB) family NADH-FMN oxidoreductase RutF